MIDTAIRTYLLAQSAITTIVGSSGAFVGRANQGASLPYIVIEQIGGKKEQHSSGVSGLERADVAIGAWSTTDVKAGVLADAISTALAAKQVTMGSALVRACIEIDKTRATEEPTKGDQAGYPLVLLTYEVFFQS